MSEANRSIADLNREQKAKYKTEKNTFNDFPVGTKVKVVCCWQDFHFFYEETGTVTKNSYDYLGIIVEFDKPRRFKGGMVQTDFNFAPDDLHIIEVCPNKCPYCGK